MMERTPLSRTLIQEKCAILHKKPKGEDETFMVGEGWLHRLKKCHGIRQDVIAGKTLVDQTAEENQFVYKFENLVKENKLNSEKI